MNYNKCDRLERFYERGGRWLFLSIALFSIGVGVIQARKAKHSRWTLSAPVPDKDSAAKAAAADTLREITFVFGGDVMSHLPQTQSASLGEGKYDFAPVFEWLSPYIKQGDISVVNLETTFAGPPYSGYPQFCAPDTLGWFLKNAGFNIIVTANNHSADRGGPGIARTVEVLKKYDITATGTFSDSADYRARHPLMLVRKGFKIAILNYTYGTNGLPVPAPNIVNRLDTAGVGAGIRAARRRGAEIIIPVLHWGIEYQLKENAEQRAMARYCLQQGATLVVGAHPHVVQPFIWEKYTDSAGRAAYGPVMYSLGNLVSNQRKMHTDGGALLKVRLQSVRNGRPVVAAAPELLPVYVDLTKGNPPVYRLRPAPLFSRGEAFATDADEAQGIRFLNDFRARILPAARDSAHPLLPIEWR